jgi:hypothetical protein
MKLLAATLAVASIVAPALAAYCSGSPDAGERTNDYPVYDGALRYLRSVENGVLYEAGPESSPFYVVHVYGSGYEMGYAQGQLLKDTIYNFITQAWAYFEDMIVGELDGVPEPIAKALADKTLDKALDWTYDMTREYTGDYFFEEMQGLSDATGVDYDTLVRVHMFPELTKGQCSFFGAWDTATTDGKTIQLRALDWDVDGPFKDYPAVIIYHPDDGNVFANVGWTGFVGAITGMSAESMGISEIGVSYPDDSFGQGTYPNTPPEKVKGTPFIFMLRDILQFTDSLEEAISHMENAERTCNLILGVGDGEEAMVNGIQYSGYVLVPYDDMTLLPENDTWHPQIQDVVYNGMDWLCPAYTEVLGEQLAKFHGELTPERTISDILPTAQTGNLHIAVYDLTEQGLYVGFARKSTGDASEPFNAYERPFTHLNMRDIFSEPRPNVSAQ